MSKKKIFGLVLFIVIGLFMFTFANPNEESEDKKAAGDNTSIVEKKDGSNKEEKEIEDEGTLLPVETVVEQPVAPVTPAGPVVPQVTIEELRQLAKTELANYASSLGIEDEKKKDEIVNDANALIDEANTKALLDSIVYDAKKLLDEVKTAEELAKAKTLALEEINGYNSDYDYVNDDEYSNLLNEATKNVNDASTKEDVEKVVNNYKTAIDELIDLDDYKKAAILEVVTYKDSLGITKLLDKVEEVVGTAKDKINGVSYKEEIDLIVIDAKALLDEIKALIETVFEVKFIGLNNSLLLTTSAVYGEAATAPEVLNEEINGIVYEFANWDLDYTNVTSNLVVTAKYNVVKATANVMLDTTLLGTVELNVTDELKNIVLTNVNTTINTNEDTIKNYVASELPKLNKNYYKYDFVSLNYDEFGFNIKVVEIVDEAQVIAHVFVLNEGVQRPSNTDRLPSTNFKKIGTVKLNTEKVQEFFNGKITTISNDVASYIEGTLPVLDREYYYYDFYVLKYENDGFHIDAEVMFDLEKYTTDKTNELNSLLEKDYSIYQDTKTRDSYNALINAVEKGKLAITLEEIEASIAEITNAENSLVDVVFIGYTLSSNNDIYTLFDSMKNVTLTAVYNDTYRNYEVTDYTLVGEFNTSTVGNKSLTFSINGNDIVYNYTVNYSYETLKYMADRVSAVAYVSLKWDGLKYLGEEYSVGFLNLDGLTVKSIEKIAFGQVKKTISFTNTNGKILISKDDYYELVTNDPLFSREKIRVTYVINNQEVTVEYNAFLGIML